MSQTNEMTQARFAEILDAYGAEPRRWPEAERAAAEAFMARQADIAEPLLAEARALDDAMGPAAAAPGDLLEARILARLLRPAPRPAAIWRPAGAIAAMLLIGVCLGFAGGALTAPGDSGDDALYADAFTGLEEDWIDWLGGEA